MKYLYRSWASSFSWVWWVCTATHKHLTKSSFTKFPVNPICWRSTNLDLLDAKGNNLIQQQSQLLQCKAREKVKWKRNSKISPPYMCVCVCVWIYSCVCTVCSNECNPTKTRRYQVNHIGPAHTQPIFQFSQQDLRNKFPLSRTDDEIQRSRKEQNVETSSTPNCCTWKPQSNTMLAFDHGFWKFIFKYLFGNEIWSYQKLVPHKIANFFQVNYMSKHNFKNCNFSSFKFQL